jgi:DNA polymerase
MKTLFLDTETYNTVPISAGTYAYAETCEVDILTWAIDDGEVHTEDLANGGSTEAFRAAAAEADIVVAHNAMFDRNVLRFGLGLDIPIENWRCSMARALAHGLPGGLDKLGDILGVKQDHKKLKDGRALVLYFCKPRPNGARASKVTDPEKWARYLEYAAGDVVAMRAICEKLPQWNYTFDLPGGDRPRDLELAHWHRDQHINDRGFHVDRELVDAALRAVAEEQARLKAKTRDDTEYDSDTGEGLGSTTQRDAMLAYLLEQHGLLLPDLRSSTVEKVLEKDDLPPEVRSLLEIRLQVTSTSTSKYKSLARGVTRRRMRGTIQFDGAARTRRAAGRTFQPQNLPSRGLLPQSEIDVGIQCLLAGSADLIFPDVMRLTTSTIRGVIKAPTGRKLVVSDLSNIEGRAMAFLAGENWKVQAFKDFDAGTGPDLYKLAYAKAFRIDASEVDKFGRQIGKVMELALQYAGGVNAFVTFALVYGIDLEVMADTAWPALPPLVVAEAEDFLDWQAKQGTTFPMSRKAATVCEVFKRLWRSAHPATAGLWKLLENGFRQAVANPGETVEAGKMKIRRDGAWVRVVMPSGRALCYPHPKVDDDGKITFSGVNQFTKKWGRIGTFGGKLSENLCQSFARDILYDAMPGIEDAGYDIVLHVHDEVICEAPDSPEFNAAHLSSLLATPPSYAADMPLAAAGFESYRYKKD